MRSFIRPHLRPAALSVNSATSDVSETKSDAAASLAASSNADARESETGAGRDGETATRMGGLDLEDTAFPLDLPRSHFLSKESESAATLIAGYGLALVVMIYSNAQWIIDEARFEGEGHSVAKTVVALFAICCYSFVNMGLGLTLTLRYIGLIFFPELTYQVFEWVKLFFEGTLHVQPMDIVKIFVAPVSAEVGCKVWNYVWKNYVCKSFHDKSCTLTALGKYIYNYKNEACFDGLASSSICEKFVSNLPLIVMTCVMVFLGSVLLPMLNDNLHDFISNVRLENELRLLNGVGQAEQRDGSDSEEFQDAINGNDEDTTEVIESEKSFLEMPTRIPYSEVLNSTSLDLNDAFLISPDDSLMEDSFRITLRRRGNSSGRDD